MAIVNQAYRRAVAKKGAPIIQIEGEKIVSDQCYSDRVALAEQLQPKE